ncbi:melanoma-associated antigen 9-like [Diceros bicornis minor]|uniref:melanoma-associated antigen 9-like n=1 Tax=Diceros bicornis minor TaxID=77932 RepID=UPI0026F2FD02|nr:melanoma-associated antigen 9-like [Diceros bicornis minor]
MSEHCKCEEDHEDPREAQGLVDAQLSGAEEEEATSSSSSPHSSSPSVLFLGSLEESSLQDALHLKMADLVGFLLLKYRTKERTTKAEKLNLVIRDHQDHFPVIFSQASECTQLVIGFDVKEVDPSDHSYILVTILGLTYDGMLSGEQSMPKTCLLVLLLGMILLEGDGAPEDDVWEALSVMGVCAATERFSYGEPRELLTKVWVQEQYVQYRQVPHSDPAHYEFLWGPRATLKPAR